MRAVKAQDTAPEMVVRRACHSAGLRYLLHDKRLPGKPDLVFPSRRLALFVHGCYWHQHPGCQAAARPASNLDYWTKKLDGNIARDEKQRESIEAMGWQHLVIWECEIRDAGKLSGLVRKITALPKAVYI